jgi:hypothetical protein
MSTSPYIVYKCNVCSRETEIVLDGRRPDPSRCNITQRCRGKLERVGERTTREFLFTPIVPGLPDFIPRGTTIVAAPKLSLPNPITVQSAAGAGIIALSAVRSKVVGSTRAFYVVDENNAQFTLETRSLSTTLPTTSLVRAVLFEISAELLTTTKYTYVVTGPVQVISGQDDSPESRSLRFTATNQISVYVNGVLIDPSGYDRSVNDQLTFTPAIYDSNNVVEVFVYKDLTSAITNANQVSLEFKALVPTITADLALRTLDAWGNYGGVSINGVERLTLFCTDLTLLDPNKSYGVAYFEAESNTSEVRKIKTSEVFFLLAKEPFAFRDKELYAYLSGTSLVDDSAVLAYKESQASGQLFLTVDETAITQVFNPITPTKKLAAFPEVITPESVSGTALEGTENLNKKYIIGPV